MAGTHCYSAALRASLETIGEGANSEPMTDHADLPVSHLNERMASEQRQAGGR